MNVSQIDQMEYSVLSRAEKMGNYLSIILKTGVVRQNFGIVQLVAGTASAIFCGFAQCLATKKEAVKWQDGYERSVSHMKNGLANIVRGEVEKHLFGGLLCVLIYDKIMKERITYIGEDKIQEEAKKAKQQRSTAAPLYHQDQQYNNPQQQLYNFDALQQQQQQQQQQQYYYQQPPPPYSEEPLYSFPNSAIAPPWPQNTQYQHVN